MKRPQANDRHQNGFSPVQESLPSVVTADVAVTLFICIV
jgi:hypothetical protein